MSPPWASGPGAPGMTRASCWRRLGCLPSRSRQVIEEPTVEVDRLSTEPACSHLLAATRGNHRPVCCDPDVLSCECRMSMGGPGG